MQIQTLKKSLEILTQVFSQKDLDAELYWNFLKDLDDEPFLAAIEDVCKTIEQVYPGTNLIGILRNKTIGIRMKPQLLGLPEGERFFNPPPKEFSDLIKKLSDEKNI